MEKYKISYIECDDSTEKSYIYEYAEVHVNMGPAAIQDFVDGHDMTNIISFRMERIK